MRWLLMTALALLLTPQAAAEDSAVMADSVDATGTLAQEGGLQALSVRQEGGGPALQDMSIHAGRLVVHEFIREGVQAQPGVCDPETVPHACRGAAQQVSDVEHVRYPSSGAYHAADLVASSSDVYMTINAFPTAHARIVARSNDFTSHSVEDACLSSDGIRDVQDEPCRGYDEDDVIMSTIPLGDAAALTNASRGAHVIVTGDFVLETAGVALRMEGTEESWWSGTRASGPAGTYEHRLLRLVIEDGTLDLGYGAEIHEAEWAVATGRIEAVDSTLTLHDASGVLDLRGGPVILDGTEKIRGDFVYSVDPRQDRVAVALEPAVVALDDASVTMASTGPWLWLTMAAAAVAVAAFSLTRRRAEMRGVEAALEAGKYRRAARLATRVLRRDPLNESAMLGRAIAWERAGRPGRVIPTVQEYLEEREPNDGALHYVLGLAYLDLGDKDSAKDALAEATRRTPALLADVAPELRPRPDAAGYS